MRKTARRNGFVLGLAALFVVALGAGIAWAEVTGDSSPDRRIQYSTSPPNLTDLHAEIDAARAAGRIGIVDHTGKFRGYVPFTGGFTNYSQYPKGVIPVTDDAGNVTGYDVPGVGFTEKSIVDDPDFNVDDYAAHIESQRLSQLTPEERQQYEKEFGDAAGSASR